MSVFHGNWNEDAEAFLNSYLERMGSLDDEKLARSFVYYLQAESDADEWFEELPEEEKESWASIEVLFRRKWLKQEVRCTKKVETIENEIQVLPHSPKIAQKQVFSLHKPSNTSTSSPTTSSVPTKPQTTPSQHSELAQATATSPQPFSPPTPFPAPKPPEIGSKQPISSSQHLEIDSPTRVAMSWSLALPKNGKNTKFGTTRDTTSKISDDITVFSSPMPSATSLYTTAPSYTTTALETPSTMAIFTQKLENIEISSIITQTTPKTPSPYPFEHKNDTLRLYATLPMPNDAVSQPPMPILTASSSPISAAIGHKKSAFLHAILGSQPPTESLAFTSIVTVLKMRSESTEFMKNCQKVEKSLNLAQKDLQLVVSGHSNCANGIYSFPVTTTIVTALKTHSALAISTKNYENIENSLIFNQHHPKSLILECSNWGDDTKLLPTPSILPTKHPCAISG